MDTLLFAICFLAALPALTVCLYFAEKEESTRRAGLSKEEAYHEWQASQW